MASPQKLSDADLMRRLARSSAGAPAPNAEPLAWGDVPGQALKNAPGSAGDLVNNMLFPFLHPIQTAETFIDIGHGLLSKAGIAESKEAEATVNAIGTFFAARYGSVDNLKRTLATDPVGVAADVATVLSGGAALGARAPGVAGQISRVGGKVARTIDPVTALGKAAKMAGSAASVPLGLTTGAGGRAIREAGRAGLTADKTFIRHLRGVCDIN